MHHKNKLYTDKKFNFNKFISALNDKFEKNSWQQTQKLFNSI